MARPRLFDSDVVLGQASESFREKGFDGTSIEDLEKATGLRRASLYGAFGDKKALYLAALKSYQGKQGVGMLETLNAAKTGRGAIERLFQIIMDEAAGDPGGCLLANAASERSAHDAGVARCVEDNRRRVEGALLAAVLRGRADGSVKERGDARASARFLFAATLGIRALGRMGCGRTELRPVAHEALRTLD